MLCIRHSEMLWRDGLTGWHRETHRGKEKNLLFSVKYLNHTFTSFLTHTAFGRLYKQATILVCPRCILFCWSRGDVSVLVGWSSACKIKARLTLCMKCLFCTIISCKGLSFSRSLYATRKETAAVQGVFTAECQQPLLACDVSHAAINSPTGWARAGEGRVSERERESLLEVKQGWMRVSHQFDSNSEWQPGCVSVGWGCKGSREAEGQCGVGEWLRGGVECDTVDACMTRGTPSYLYMRLVRWRRWQLKLSQVRFADVAAGGRKKLENQSSNMCLKSFHNSNRSITRLRKVEDHFTGPWTCLNSAEEYFP